VCQILIGCRGEDNLGKASIRRWDYFAGGITETSLEHHIPEDLALEYDEGENTSEGYREKLVPDLVRFHVTVHSTPKPHSVQGRVA
jgi:hypothetical protein